MVYNGYLFITYTDLVANKPVNHIMVKHIMVGSNFKKCINDIAMYTIMYGEFVILKLTLFQDVPTWA